MTPERILALGPQSWQDLIGPARLIARVQCAKAAANADGTPVRLLVHGEPGCGKSSICRLVAEALRPRFTIGRVSGQHVSADDVREWISDTYLGGHGAWTVRIVEEADALSAAAQVLILQYIDLMPSWHALLCTSNQTLSALEDRFQSRFQCIAVKRPSVHDVADFIRERWAEIAEHSTAIAQGNAGDVRASLNDAQTHLDVARFA